MARLDADGTQLVWLGYLGGSSSNCGEVQFVDWEGDEPVTIRWRLAQSLPDRLKHSFKVGEG